MKKLAVATLGLAFAGLSSVSQADDFLTNPEQLHKDKGFGHAQIFFADGVEKKFANYDSLMVDEPVIFLADDSPYKGFKASDFAMISDSIRKSMISGLTGYKSSAGSFKAVDEPGPKVLYVRMAIKDIYVHKEKRGLLSYTPVGIVVKGVSDIASDTLDKTTLVEMQLEVEMQDSTSGEVLFAGILDRGQRKDKATHTKEQAISWEKPGKIAEKLGERLACRLDNVRLPKDKYVDCIKAIPIK